MSGHLKSKEGSSRDLAVEVADAIDDTPSSRTKEGTPTNQSQGGEGNKIDIEKAINEQRDGLPAPIEIPDGGWLAWRTVFGAYVSLL
jgi:hypothetical protein